MANFGDTLISTLNKAQDLINENASTTQENQFSKVYTADGNGLPYTKVLAEKSSQFTRNTIVWYVPEFGLVRMYINPQNITYEHKKLISKDRTKGGYTLQYWGEDLTVINISGTTGSAGIEGINMLYELYRAEQYANDGVALTIAASNAANDLANQSLSGIGGLLGGEDLGREILGGILGADSPSANSLSSSNITTMAQLAFTVEMFYNGWIYRGYFQNMTVTERADNFLLDYKMDFIATQRRGYRVNYYPWSRSARGGPSQYDTPLASRLNDKDIG